MTLTRNEGFDIAFELAESPRLPLFRDLFMNVLFQARQFGLGHAILAGGIVGGFDRDRSQPTIFPSMKIPYHSVSTQIA